MKTLLLCSLVLLAISATAQSGWESAGVYANPGAIPRQENLSSAEIAQRNHDARMQFAHGQILRVSNGKIYNVVENQQWQFVGGTVYEKSGRLVIFQQPTGRRADWTYAAITNFQGEVLIDKTFSGLAIRAGTFLWNNDSPIAIYDMGQPYVPPPPKPATPEQIAAAKAAQEKAKVKAAEQKKIAVARALQANQDAAAKGDEYGLLRMGERYRDGDGVEKDLGKAREYLQRAADAGSPMAKEELSNLK
jgi:hypothetical protein